MIRVYFFMSAASFLDAERESIAKVQEREVHSRVGRELQVQSAYGQRVRVSAGRVHNGAVA